MYASRWWKIRNDSFDDELSSAARKLKRDHLASMPPSKNVWTKGQLNLRAVTVEVCNESLGDRPSRVARNLKRDDLDRRN